jgi:ABC-type glycerol-3-phosphate transport system permease component
VSARLARIGPWNLLVTVLVGTVAVAWLLPLWLVLTTAMKSVPEYARDASQWQLPRDPATLLQNVAQAWSSAGLGPGFVTSLLYGVSGACLAILFASLGAYAITRLELRGRFFWFMLVFSGTIFPFQMYLIPLFKLYSDTGLYDTWAGMVCFYTAIAIPFCLFVLRGFFATVPRELQEAARLDGSGDFGIFWRIFVPLARGPIAVLFLFQFTWIWNDLLFGLVLSTSDGVRPIMPSLAGLQGTYSHTGPPVVLAGALVATVPTLLLFLLLGRYLMQGLTLTTGRTT